VWPIGQITTSPIPLYGASGVRFGDIGGKLCVESTVHVWVRGTFDRADVADLTEWAGVLVCVGWVAYV